MQLSKTQSLFNIVEQHRLSRFTGSVTVTDDQISLVLWFVRGNLAHAASNNGDCGWKALETAKDINIRATAVAENVLPPERTIRIDTIRLLKAMRVSNVPRRQSEMHVPIPLHARLQQRFNELRRRSTGLKSFESNQRVMEKNATNGALTSQSEIEDRIIIERDPRGAKWIHQIGDRQLIVNSDESVTTAELMWVGAELWREYEMLNKAVRSEND